MFFSFTYIYHKIKIKILSLTQEEKQEFIRDNFIFYGLLISFVIYLFFNLYQIKSKEIKQKKVDVPNNMVFSEEVIKEIPDTLNINEIPSSTFKPLDITTFSNNSLNQLKNKYGVKNYAELYHNKESLEELEKVCDNIAEFFIKTRVVNYNYTFAQEFFNKEKIRIALLEGMRFRIPASVKLAQCYIESHDPKRGDITSLAKENNFFGIKAKKSDKNKMYIVTTEFVNKQQKKEFNGRIIEEVYMGNNLFRIRVKDYFMVYNTTWESFRHHSEKMVNNKRYSPLFVHTTDYKGWCDALQESNYATASNYGETLKRLIEKFYLYELDHN